MPDEMQSWSNFYDQCDDYYIKEVSIEEYGKAMDKLIKKGKKLNIDVTLMMLLEKAAKYHIKEQSQTKNTKKSKPCKHNVTPPKYCLKCSVPFNPER